MIRVVVLQRENSGGAHINKSGSGAERAIRVQRAIKVVVVQRERER